MKKFFKVFFSVLGIIVLVAIIAWTALDIAKYIVYADYYEGYKPACEIPDIHSGFTPQGITYLPASDAYLQSGYDGEHLALYYVKGTDHKKLLPLDMSGNLGKGHGGGVTATDRYVYIAGDGALLRYDLSEVLAAKAGDRITCLEEIKVDNSASFCFADGDKMYVGEFYRAGNYEIEDTTHHYTTPEGEEHRAIVSCYTIHDDGTLESIPDYWISVPGLVQGFAVYNGVIAISRSWGLNSSSIEFYRGMEATDKVSAREDYSSKVVPVYYIGEKNHVKTVAAPAFSEDLTVKDGRLIVSFESACNKYKIGKIFFATVAGSYPFP